MEADIKYRSSRIIYVIYGVMFAMVVKNFLGG